MNTCITAYPLFQYFIGEALKSTWGGGNLLAINNINIFLLFVQKSRRVLVETFLLYMLPSFQSSRDFPCRIQRNL
jgi:hypothetical protein